MQFRSDMTVDLIDSMGSDQRIADAARVSTGTDGVEATQGFIDFLMKNRHGSPFEHALFTYRIECPIFVAREFLRHRIASYNELSARYSEIEPVFYIPDDCRNLVQVGKPGAYDFEPGSDEQYYLSDESIRLTSQFAYDEYMGMLDAGIAREVARMVLPVNTFTSFYVTMNARGLMNFLSLRNKTDDTTVPTYPLREIEMVAEKMETHFAGKLPMTYGAFIHNGRVSP